LELLAHQWATEETLGLTAQALEQQAFGQAVVHITALAAPAQQLGDLSVAEMEVLPVRLTQLMLVAVVGRLGTQEMAARGLGIWSVPETPALVAVRVVAQETQANLVAVVELASTPA
jgi:hypothetical protein